MSAQSRRREEEIEGEEGIGNAPTVAVEEKLSAGVLEESGFEPRVVGGVSVGKTGPLPFGETPTPQFTTW
ncbi:hypothetical protein MRX96_046339 [Rhipicephalus microplus]